MFSAKFRGKDSNLTLQVVVNDPHDGGLTLRFQILDNSRKGRDSRTPIDSCMYTTIDVMALERIKGMAETVKCSQVELNLLVEIVRHLQAENTQHPPIRATSS